MKYIIYNFWKKISNSEKLKSKFKSPVVWLAVVAQIGIILTVIFGQNVSNDAKVVMTSVVEILTVFGILNNPDDKSDF